MENPNKDTSDKTEKLLNRGLYEMRRLMKVTKDADNEYEQGVYLGAKRGRDTIKEIMDELNLDYPK